MDLNRIAKMYSFNYFTYIECIDNPRECALICELKLHSSGYTVNKSMGWAGYDTLIYKLTDLDRLYHDYYHNLWC